MKLNEEQGSDQTGANQKGAPSCEIVKDIVRETKNFDCDLFWL